MTTMSTPPVSEDATMADEPLRFGPYALRSRLIVGSGKYASPQQNRDALIASGADMITVAVRRVDLKDPDNLLRYIGVDGVRLLPNTAGCYTKEDALRTARLAREALDTPLVKLEVIGDAKTLYPDTEATVAAAIELVKEGFVVLPYTTDDPVTARRLQDAGCAAVMPLGSPIGSGLGPCNLFSLQLVMEAVSIPVIVDAGVGKPSHAATVMEMGVAGVLMNTGIALARQPIAMARAMALAVKAGRQGYLAGPMAPRLYASASSPVEGRIETVRT